MAPLYFDGFDDIFETFYFSYSDAIDSWVICDFIFFFNSSSVILGRWASDTDRLCAMAPCLLLKRSAPQVELKIWTAGSVVFKKCNSCMMDYQV